ncbi:MAG: sugar-phosphatase [Streptococcaceae bacterium]|jgi:Cof subfamily protein (haloacid dehalogenase superfamily)|nr:sugar-phosphatase [Streptococcaceae bacterium]
MIKLIAIDIDGTLVDNERKITPEVKAAVKDATAAGVKVVISTGRPLLGVTEILDELGLNKASDFVITFNGALVQRATGEIFVEETLTPDDFYDLDAAAKKVGVHFQALTRDGVYTSNRDIGRYTVYESYSSHSPLHFRQPEEIAALDLAKVMMIDEPKILDNAIAYLPFEFFERFTMVKSTPFFLEFMNKKVSKGMAVAQLAKKLFLDTDELMAIGDEENDRSMLEAVGNPVVMGNGKEELKKIAKYITKPNTESGVAYAIREWVLKDY